MTTFFHVLNNVKHNGDVYEKNTIVQGELDEFQVLVNDGLFEIVDGAKSVEDAKELIDEKMTLEDSEPEPVTPENTWEAQPDEEEPIPEEGEEEPGDVEEPVAEEEEEE